MRCEPDPDRNLSRAQDAIADAAQKGAEGQGIRFWGGSFVVDPFGRVLATAPDDEEAVLVVDCDLAATERVRRDWPFLRDRRIDAYAGLGEHFMDEPARYNQADSMPDSD